MALTLVVYAYEICIYHTTIWGLVNELSAFKGWYNNHTQLSVMAILHELLCRHESQTGSHVFSSCTMCVKNPLVECPSGVIL